ncbi:MAG: hypothetical protein ACYTFV_10160 [Planctomycetota bacterium]|jgi:tetratricopeptide (TPR) repeat protein
MIRSSSVLATFAALSLGCLGPAFEPAPLFEGTGEHHRPVDVRTELAQAYFDQGLALAFGFNHEEAVRSFRTAAHLDPNSSMARWGAAYALGPNINMPVGPEASREAHAEIQAALARDYRASEVDRALIEALSTRFAPEPPEDRMALDEAYAEAMGAVWERFPEDPDVGFLYADALMNLTPWDLWTLDFEPTRYTSEIIATLERVMELDPCHPGANHLYIHALEASSDPGRAEEVADRLGELTPGLGHMVHMPSHIYVQVGRFEDAVRVNERGSALDREYFARVGDRLVYHFYHAHNNHFRVWSALYQGDYEEALEAARLTLEDLPDAFEADPGTAEFLIADVHVHLRFGKWEAVLEVPRPREDQPFAIAMWRYGRGVAYANTDRTALARVEREAFEAVADSIPPEAMLGRTPARDVLEVARQMLNGELFYKEGDVERGLEHLRLAVDAEDRLLYSEPSPWMVPTRHALGALLLEQGQVSEARNAYAYDLQRHPGNVWGLRGMVECLERGDDPVALREYRARFEEASRFATVDVRASCFCSADE